MPCNLRVIIKTSQTSISYLISLPINVCQRIIGNIQSDRSNQFYLIGFYLARFHTRTCIVHFFVQQICFLVTESADQSLNCFSQKMTTTRHWLCGNLDFDKEKEELAMLLLLLALTKHTETTETHSTWTVVKHRRKFNTPSIQRKEKTYMCGSTRCLTILCFYLGFKITFC